MKTQYYAHSQGGKPPSDWQPLEDHLINVAKLADEFARCFGANSWARLAGQNHDVGKGTPPWQAYLRHENEIRDDFMQYYTGRVEHAALGAQKLYKRSKEAGKLLAYCIAGHHGGLQNWNDSPENALKIRLARKFPEIEIPINFPEFPKQLPFETPDKRQFGFQLQFFVRMLFSCLVDADFLDTEAALDKKKEGWRSRYPPLSELRESFWSNFDRLRNTTAKD